MQKIRQAAVAGSFYPAHKKDLNKLLEDYLATPPQNSSIPKAIIAPHAGYIYSGPIAGSAYKYLANVQAKTQIKRVVLLGPSHFVACHGLALSNADVFATPLGNIHIDKKTCQELLALPQVFVMDEAHAREHSLEVHLPFLQTTLDTFELVPLTVGQTSYLEVAEVLEMVWSKANTLIVISSDLTHFYDYNTACRLDKATAKAIESLQPDKINHGDACGRVSIQALLHLAHKFNTSVKTVDLRNSGDTAGSKDKVVGYGAWVFN